MTDISKLKAEAEEAHRVAANLIKFATGTSDKTSSNIASKLIAATIAQIALQAAEKEAEAQEKADHMRNFEMLKDEFEAQQKKKVVHPDPIADDGWIKWEGGECPVTPETNVCVRWHDGDESVISRQAQFYSWARNGGDLDIIAYRIVQPAADRVSES